MQGLRLLPGEREQMRLRPHVASFGLHFLRAALPGLWGAALLWVFHAPWWVASAAEWWKVWQHLVGHAWNAYATLVLGLAVLAAIAAGRVLRVRLLAVYLTIAAATTLLSLLWPFSYRWGIPAILWAFSVLAVAGVEVSRRREVTIVTNLRMVLHGGLVLKRERQWRYEEITDLDGRQGPMARLLRYGTIVPVMKAAGGTAKKAPPASRSDKRAQRSAKAGRSKKTRRDRRARGDEAGGDAQGAPRPEHDRLVGVHPYEEVKRRLETLIQDATATPFLRGKGVLPAGWPRHDDMDIPVFGAETE